ncbi:MAG: choice-of-anchor Q domain-containing protein [Ignavibacteria bacterium]|jgi:hypothetical protein
MKKRFFKRFIFIACFCTVIISFPAFAATITVTNTNDSGTGSLRQAITNATSGDVIEFSVTGTITLSSQLTIGKNLTINGPGASALTISGNSSVRVIEVNSSYTLNINNLSIKNGTHGSYGGGIENDQGTLTIDNCFFSGNEVTGTATGGAVDAYNGSLTITNSTFSGNTAGGRGGAVSAYGGTTTIENCTLDNNHADMGGAIGQLQSTGNLTVTNCTISNNQASDIGGGIYWYNGNTVNINNSTLSGNNATNQGGAFADGTGSPTVNINSCTLVNNTVTSGSGGGIDLRGATVNMKNTILASNTATTGANLNTSGSGTLNSQGYNLCDAALSAFTGTGDIQSGTLNIGALADNGGSTQTHALLAGSDAIDAIPEGGNSYNGAYATDQRGNTRPNGTNADIGAFELITAPASQATDVSFSNLAATTATISWTRPASNGGQKCAVFIKASGTGTSAPIDKNTYTANVNYGSGTQIGSTGWYCIYNGTGTTVNITGITGGTTYRVHVCEYNGIAGCEVYNTNSGSSGNPNEQVLPVELTSFTASVDENVVILNWQTATEVNNYGFEVERKTVTQIASNLCYDWETIGFVNGNGNSNSPKSYSYTDTPTGGATTFKYRLKQIDFDGAYEYSDEIEVTLDGITEYSLEQNYPNPFNPTTTIKYQVPEAGNDTLGREVKTLVNETQSSGVYSIEFNASQLASGVYIYKLKCNDFVQTKKLLLMK